MTMLSERSISE